ncbi:MAG TPA: hypothetical protein VFU63_02700 [Ktedonobacterales bacterium]|nr:hypothetical protein [Ktedonobacterales bacterium]
MKPCVQILHMHAWGVAPAASPTPPAARRAALKLFVYAWNRRQLFRRAHPKYPTHVFQFTYPK